MLLLLVASSAISSREVLNVGCVECKDEIPSDWNSLISSCAKSIALNPKPSVLQPRRATYIGNESTSTELTSTRMPKMTRMVGNNETKKCGEMFSREVMPFLLAAYLIMTNLILFNLLIAMFKYSPFLLPFPSSFAISIIIFHSRHS